jgi:hypothetical protein
MYENGKMVSGMGREIKENDGGVNSAMIIL